MEIIEITQNRLYNRINERNEYSEEEQSRIATRDEDLYTLCLDTDDYVPTLYYDIYASKSDGIENNIVSTILCDQSAEIIENIQWFALWKCYSRDFPNLDGFTGRGRISTENSANGTIHAVLSFDFVADGLFTYEDVAAINRRKLHEIRNNGDLCHNVNSTDE